jgi:IS5 family transposase
VIDVHCRTKWPHGTNVGPQVALRNLATDKGYDDMSFRDKLRLEGVRPLIKHRVFAPSDHAHSPRIEDDLYNQRWVCEIVNLVIKRSDGLMAST